VKEVVRLQWARGFVEEDDGGSGAVRTTFVSMTNLSSEADARAAAQATLEQLAGPRQTITADVAGDVWAGPGDTFQLVLPTGTETEVVRSREVQVDQDTGRGRVTYGLADPADLLAERLALSVRRLGNGTASGRAAAASLSNAVPTGLPSGALEKVTVPPWSFAPPAVGVGPTWTNDGDDVQLTAVVAVTAPPISGGGSCDLKVYVAGTLVRAMTIPGAFFGQTALCQNTIIRSNDTVYVEISGYTGTAPTTKLVVQLLVAPARLATKD
jgi:hypothetical protein